MTFAQSRKYGLAGAQLPKNTPALSEVRYKAGRVNRKSEKAMPASQEHRLYCLPVRRFQRQGLQDEPLPRTRGRLAQLRPDVDRYGPQHSKQKSVLEKHGCTRLP